MKKPYTIASVVILAAGVVAAVGLGQPADAPPSSGTVTVRAARKPYLPPAPDSEDQFKALAQANAALDAEIAGDINPEIDIAPGWIDGPLGVFAGNSRSRNLIISAGGADNKRFSNIEEDLNIMSRILAKSLKEKGVGREKDDVTAMGMKIRALTLSGSSSVQNIYLDGYGALFLLNVPFPLVAPAEPVETESKKEAEDSTWEEAKKELYGPRESGKRANWLNKSATTVPYDERKVEKLKSALIQSLKNASNIRDLKPEEFVTITVIGAPNTSAKGGDGLIVQQGKTRITSARRFSIDGAAPQNETMMVLRAAKSDIDAFTQGKTGLDELQTKVKISNY
jgi:hypothetical protein